jgi:hypothetical protein
VFLYASGNYAFTELPKGTEFRQSCDYDAAQDKFTQSVLEPDNLLRKLLHRPVSWQLALVKQQA